MSTGKEEKKHTGVVRRRGETGVEYFRKKLKKQEPRVLSVVDTAELLMSIIGSIVTFDDIKHATYLLMDAASRGQMAPMDSVVQGEKLSDIVDKILHELLSRHDLLDCAPLFLDGMHKAGCTFGESALRKTVMSSIELGPIRWFVEQQQVPVTAELVHQYDRHTEKTEEDGLDPYIDRPIFSIGNYLLSRLNTEEMEKMGPLTWNYPGNHTPPLFYSYARAITRGLDMSYVTGTHHCKFGERNRIFSDKYVRVTPYTLYDRLALTQVYATSSVRQAIETCKLRSEEAILPLLKGVGDLMKLAMEYTIYQHVYYDRTPLRNMRYRALGAPEDSVLLSRSEIVGLANVAHLEKCAAKFPQFKDYGAYAAMARHRVVPGFEKHGPFKVAVVP